MNRYTQLTESKYNPYTLQELILAPSYLRKQHDDAVQKATELGIINSQRLSNDEDVVSQAILDYENQVSNYASELANKGFNQQSKYGLFDLAAKKRELLSNKGIVGIAQNNYNAYMKNKESLQKMYQSGKISKDKYERGLQLSLEQYKNMGGAAKNATYSDFNAVQDVDVIEKARKIALDVQKNPKILEQFGIIQKGNRYYDVKRQTEYTPEEAIQKAIEYTFNMDSNIMSDLNQRQQLDLLGDMDAQGYIKTLGQLDEAIYGKNVTKETRSGFFLPNSNENDKNNSEQPIPSSYDFLQSNIIHNNKLKNKLKDIIENNTIEVYEGTYGMHDTPTYSNETATIENNFDDNELQQYNHIVDLLKSNNLITENTSKEDINKLVFKQLDKFQDVPFANPIIEPNTIEGKRGAALMMNTTDINKTNASIKSRIVDNRMSLWDENGEPVEINNLPNNFKVLYTGYIGADNYLPEFKNSEKHQNVVPHRIQILDEDGNFKGIVYGSRNSYERNKPEFKAFTHIKDITYRGTKNLGLPDTFNVDPLDDLYNVTDKYKAAFDPSTQLYKIEFLDKNTDVLRKFTFEPKEFKNFWHNLYKGLETIKKNEKSR